MNLERSPGEGSGEGRAEQSATLPRITAHFIKSNFFRVVHADGVWGGVTQDGNVQMSFFNNRTAIPQSVEIEIEPDGRNVEVDRTGKSGWVREVEVSIVMDLTTAMSFRAWLSDRIDRLTALEQT